MWFIKLEQEKMHIFIITKYKNKINYLVKTFEKNWANNYY